MISSSPNRRPDGISWARVASSGACNDTARLMFRSAAAIASIPGTIPTVDTVRQITVSTVGIVPGIDAMAAADLNINLAVSLHAPDDATRAQLIPSGRRFGLDEIMAAADRFQAKNHGRPVSIQYC